jgi:phage-related protein (TIGR01555 family)
VTLTDWLATAAGFVTAAPKPSPRLEPDLTPRQPQSSRLRLSPEALARARATAPAPFELYTTRQLHPNEARALHPPARPPAGVVPANVQPMAMDEDLSGFYVDQGLGNSMYSEGMHWLGTPYLAELAQRAEYRQISETYARDMTRAWIKIQGSGEEDKGDKIKLINEAFDRHKVQHKFRRMAELDGFFGRGHLYIDVGVPMDDRELMRTAIILDRRTVKKGSLKNIHAVNPLASDFYVPVTWYVMGREVHRTRLLTFVGREVPDLLKPSYAFGGLSMSQMAKPYVDNWLRTRQSVSDLIHSFSVFALATDMSGTLTGGAGADERARADLFTLYRDNSGLFLYDKNREDFKNISASLGTLDHLQAQSQEHICSVSGIPLVVFTGITPTGLNTTSEGELQAWAQRVHSAQENLFGDHLNFILDLVQLDLFGEIDPEITVTFEPLKEESDAERATRAKTEADIDAAYVSMGALAPDDVRQVLAEQETGRYAAVDLSGPPPDPPGMGADPLGAGPGAGGGGFGAPGGGGSSGPPGGAAGGAPSAPGGAGGTGKPGVDEERMALDDEKFEEADHPRDESGKFAKSAGGAAAAVEYHKAAAAHFSGLGAAPTAVRQSHERALTNYTAAHEHYVAGATAKGHAAHAKAEKHAETAAAREKKYGFTSHENYEPVTTPKKNPEAVKPLEQEAKASSVKSMIETEVSEKEGSSGEPGKEDFIYNPRNAAQKTLYKKISEIPPQRTKKESHFQDVSGQETRAVLEADTGKIPGDFYARVTSAYAGGRPTEIDVEGAVDSAMHDYMVFTQSLQTAEEREALINYKSEKGGSDEINNHLLGKEQGSSLVKDNIKKINGLMDRSFVPADTPVHRGMRISLKELVGTDDPGAAVGRGFEHKNFASVSRDEKVAKGFLIEKGSTFPISAHAMLHFTVPAGAKGILLGGQDFGTEKEMVLPSGGVFVIDRVEEMPNTGRVKGYHVHVTYLGTKKDE